MSGIPSAFSGHGYCTGGGSPNPFTWSTPRYISTPIDSLTSQGDVNGTMHPNDLGQQAIANVIYNGYLSLPLMSASVSAPSPLIAGDPSSFTVQTLTFANAPIAGASVLVDGNLVGHTDNSGILNVGDYVFPAVGNHTIVTEAAGYPDARAVLVVAAAIIPVPNVVGLPATNAVSAIRSAGLLPIEVSSVDTTCNNIGYVINQSPRADTPIATGIGSPVTITVAVKPPTPCP